MPELDREKLSEEFDIIDVKNTIHDINTCESDDLLKNNIDRANRILDRMEYEMENGNFSARMAEVTSQLINAVTTAISQNFTNNYNISYLQLRDNIVKLKEIELKHKLSYGKGPKTLNQNIIVTDRESLLKFLKGESDIKQLKDIRKEGENGGDKDG